MLTRFLHAKPVPHFARKTLCRLLQVRDEAREQARGPSVQPMMSSTCFFRSGIMPSTLAALVEQRPAMDSAAP